MSCKHCFLFQIMLVYVFLCSFTILGFSHFGLRKWSSIIGKRNSRLTSSVSLLTPESKPIEKSKVKDEVVGNTQSIPNTHPVIDAVVKRWREGSKPGCRNDTNKIALSIEGGGMRGCVAAGASAALNFLGLNDAVDVVYGSSAGAMVGAYFVARQYSGVEIYHG